MAGSACARSTAVPAALAAALAAATLPAPLLAQVGLPVTRLDAEGAVRVDGDLREWPRLGVRFGRAGAAGPPAFRYALAYDDLGLYVAADVEDRRLVRTARPGRLEDALVLTLAVPEGRGLRAVDVWLFAGIPGRQAASAAVAPLGDRGALRPAREVRVVEGPPEAAVEGYALEAFVPWSAVPSAPRWQEGRGALRFQDVNREARPAVDAVVATAAVDPARPELLPELLPSGGESAVLRGFLRARGLHAARPRFDLRGDVAGSPEAERVVVVDRFVVVFGPQHRGGDGFDFLALPVDTVEDVREARLDDVTGDGQAELLLRYRVEDGDVSHEIWRVYDPEAGGIRPLLGVEVRREARGAVWQAPVRVEAARRGPPSITEVAAEGPPEAPDGLPLARFEPGVETLLLPWGDWRSRTWRWDGRGFAVVEEVPAPPRPPAPRPVVQATSGQAPRVPDTPGSPAYDPSGLEAIARRRAGVPDDTRPRFAHTANVVGDRQPESLRLYGRGLAVFGPGFRGGQGAFFVELPVAHEADVLDLRAEDLTGDRVAEILVRVRERAATARGDVVREVLLVHALEERGFPRLLALEVARRVGDASVEAEVRVRGGRRPALELRPGRAVGWSAETWPFAPEPPDADPRPVPLPWRDGPVVYRWSGGGFRATSR